ncbi:interferon regulatory factor 9 isoform 2-T2 [Aulostomus maculatus]
MAAVKMRSTRRLRAWIVEQVSSGKYPGLVWDDEAKTMFRIPWKHAGKQDFRKDEDAAIFKAWAEFKGKMKDESCNNPAVWKTRLRCALNKSPEFLEVMDRAQLDISEPYKVYRLVPLSEQGLALPEKKCREKPARRSKRRSRLLESDDDSGTQVKQIKREETRSQQSEDLLPQSDEPVQPEEPAQLSVTIQRDAVDELRLDMRIEESIPAPPADQDLLQVVVYYFGTEVLRRQIHGTDVRVMYLPSSCIPPPMPAALNACFPRVPLPEPSTTMHAGPERQALLTLLPFMEKGVLLSSTSQGIYGKRFCQGRIFWTGPHVTTPGPHRMERNTDLVLLFSKDIFRQQLDHFRSNGGVPPQCSVTLCFGEELSSADDPAGKLIIVQVTLPWAVQEVKNAQSIFESISILQSLASHSGEITLNLVSV